MEPKKNPRADLENKRFVFWEIGLAVSIFLTYIAMNWKFSEGKVSDLGQVSNVEIEEEIIPITQQNEPPPPPPPPPPQVEIIEIVEDTKEIKNEVSIQDAEAEQNTQITPVETIQQEEVKEEEIFTIVESMPALPGCENEPNEQAKQACTTQKIFMHFQKTQRYPQMAKEAGIQGTVFVSFVVDKTGAVSKVEILKGIAGGKELEDEAIRMVKTLPKFTPGKQRGQPVSVRYTVPIKFVLK